MTKALRGIPPKKLLRCVALFGVALVLFHLAYALFGPKNVYLAAQVLIAVAASLFSVVYHATARWWQSAMGRNIMLLVGSIAAIVDLGLVFNLMGRPEWMREVFAVLYLAVGVAILRRVGILIDAQYHSPEHPGSGTPPKR